MTQFGWAMAGGEILWGKKTYKLYGTALFAEPKGRKEPHP